MKEFNDPGVTARKILDVNPLWKDENLLKVRKCLYLVSVGMKAHRIYNLTPALHLDYLPGYSPSGYQSNEVPASI